MQATSLVAGLEDLAMAFMSKDKPDELLDDELVKLQECDVFEVCGQNESVPGARWLYPRWVGTEQKSRLTSADLKSRNAPDGIVHCLVSPDSP